MIAFAAHLEYYKILLFFFVKLQTQSENDDSMAIAILFGQMFLSFAVILIVCFLGQSISDAFEKIEQKIYHLNWYRLPIDMWPSLLILIVGSQQSTRLQVFGSISCNREAFKDVSLINYLSFEEGIHRLFPTK